MTPSEKAAAVARVDNLLVQGLSLNKACAQAAVAKANYQAWRAKLNAHGLIKDGRTEGSGRKPKFQLTEAETNALRGLTAKHGSFAFAVEVFARSAECSHATAEMISETLAGAQRKECQAKWPLALQRLARSSDLEDDALRGPKAAMSHAQGNTKGMFWQDADGHLRALSPYGVWQLDDYSANEPYVIPTAEQGQRLCRQVLTSVDVYSSAWLGFHHVGRERDAYRGEDIARFMLHLMDAHGTMPEAVMFEMGAWNSNVVHGVEIPGTNGRRWGAWREIFHVVNGFTSRFKAALESNHRMLQTALRLSGRSLGSYRGEMESGTKAYLKIQDGKLDPTAAKFLPQDDSSQIHAEAGQYLNARPKLRRAFGGKHLVPDQLLQSAWTPRPLPTCERWRFYPIKKQASVRGNFVEVRATEHYADHFIFRVNGVSEVYFQPGHRILIAFDPLALHLGAVIANGDASTLNRAGWRMGQILLTAAPLYEMTPQFSFRPRHTETEPLRKTNAAIRSAFKAIRPFTLPGLAITTQTDGRGTVQEIRLNDPAQPTLRGGLATETPPRGSANGLQAVRDDRWHDDSTTPRQGLKTSPSTNRLDLDADALAAAELALSQEGWG